MTTSPDNPRLPANRPGAPCIRPAGAVSHPRPYPTRSPMPRRRPAPVPVAAPVPAPVPDPIPATVPTFTAWTRAGTLRFRWSPAPVHGRRPLTATLTDRPDAPGAPLRFPGRDQWGDIATPGAAARLLAWRWDLGEPVRRVEEVGKATDQNPIKKPASPTSPLAR